jgi:hypothetical protein
MSSTSQGFAVSAISPSSDRVTVGSPAWDGRVRDNEVRSQICYAGPL